MAMKQTQTKLFDFADVGLDFCSGSKNLFPDRFKKMLSQGYNEQTVASVSVTGNQVTLNYGVVHGYAADRVLKINSGPLAAINGGEFWIDAVTTTSLTMTIDSAPTSILGGFKTNIASLGYSLVYEQGNVYVYKFKGLDEADLYLRLCFQNQISRRNCISPCIGTTFDVNTGDINDTYALTENKSILSPGGGFKWEMSYGATSSHNGWTYNQGLSTYGKAVVVGSLFHLILFSSISNFASYGRVAGFLPTTCFDYQNIQLPVLFGESYANITSNASDFQLSYSKAFIGNIPVIFEDSTEAPRIFPLASTSKYSFLPSTIDSFNLTTATPLMIYEETTKQCLGVAMGAYIARYASGSQPNLSPINSPLSTYDIDLNSLCIVHHSCSNTGSSAAAFIMAPVEEVKIV